MDFTKYNPMGGTMDFSKYSPFGSQSEKKETKNYNIKTLDDLKTIAEQFGVDVKEKENKPSLFMRAIDYLSRPNYASANVAKAIYEKKPLKEILKEGWEGLKGQDKITYSDVLAEAGVENKYLKAGAGFALDVLLDPTTYFGGALIKGAGKVIGKGGKIAAGAGKLIAPATTEKFLFAGKTLKDALGKAFVYGYGTTPGLADDVSIALNKLGIAKEDIVGKNLSAFKGFSNADLEKAGQLMIDNRRLELQARKGAKVEYLKSDNEQINKAMELMKTKAKEMAKTAGIDEVKAYEYYIPFLRTDKLNQYAQAGFKVGKQGYNKKFNDLIADENLLKKPIESYTRREYEIARDGLIKQSMQDITKAYGKTFRSIEEAAAQGFMPIYEKSSLQFFKVKTQPGADILAQINAQKEPFEQAMMKVGKMIEEAATEGVPVSKTNALRKAQGAYYPGKNEIKLKYFKPDVLLHERGHAWDYMNSKLSKVVNTKKIFQKELKTLTNKFYGGTEVEKASAVEKWAVFIDKFIHEPKFVKKNAPMFTAYFRKMIKEDYKFRGAYQSAAKQIRLINKEVDNILPQLAKYGKGGQYLETAIKTAFPSKEFMGVAKATPIGYLKQDDFKFLNDYFYPEMKAIDAIAKATGYDSLTRVWKTAVTSYFPAFHIRNYISGNVQNYQKLGVGALSPSNVMPALAIFKGANKELRFGKTLFNAKELNKAVKENFAGASRYISDLGDYIEELAGNNFKLKKISNARQVGNFIELNQKIVAMITALKQGKTLKQALKLAEEAGFNYAKITQFESKIMRRLVPFYTFARKNAELQLSTLKNRPERILNQIKFANGLSDLFGGEKPTEQDLAGLPKWALNGLGFKLSGNRFLTSFGLPLEEFVNRVNRPGGTTLSSLNPIIKYPLEAKLGYDFFREQKLVDINKIAPATGELLLSDKAPAWIKDYFNVRKVSDEYGTRYYANPQKLHLLRNLPTSRIENTLEKLFDGDMNKTDKWVSFLSGGKIYEIDTELQKYFRERDLRRDITDELLGQGVGKTFETFYIPKESNPLPKELTK